MIRTKLLDVKYGFTNYKDIDELINEFIETRKELEDADLGWVFSCEGVEVKEVE